MDNTATNLIAYMIQIGAIDAKTGKLTDTAATHYTYDGRYEVDENYTDSTRDE